MDSEKSGAVPEQQITYRRSDFSASAEQLLISRTSLLMAANSTSSATSSATAASASTSSSCFYSLLQETPMHFPSIYNTPLQFSSALQFPVAELGGGEDSGAYHAAVGSSGTDGYDCESEEGVEVLDEPVKRVPRTRSSGSKRSRAAEVHNLSEKRRRSRINEKMKALQNLIPNSNKTDKASMLDEAIEYLKQLQLQVQMLTMRNGLNLHSMYFTGTMQHLLASQVPSSIGIGNELMSTSNGILNLSQEATTSTSFDSLSRCTSSHQPVVIPTLENISNPELSFRVESSQNICGPFKLPGNSAEIFTEGVMQQHELDDGHPVRTLQENEDKPSSASVSVTFSGQGELWDPRRVEACLLGKELSQDILSKTESKR